MQGSDRDLHRFMRSFRSGSNVRQRINVALRDTTSVSTQDTPGKLTVLGVLDDRFRTIH